MPLSEGCSKREGLSCFVPEIQFMNSNYMDHFAGMKDEHQLQE